MARSASATDHTSTVITSRKLAHAYSARDGTTASPTGPAGRRTLEHARTPASGRPSAIEKRRRAAGEQTTTPPKQREVVPRRRRRRLAGLCNDGIDGVGAQGDQHREDRHRQPPRPHSTPAASAHREQRAASSARRRTARPRGTLAQLVAGQRRGSAPSADGPWRRATRRRRAIRRGRATEHSAIGPATGSMPAGEAGANPPDCCRPPVNAKGMCRGRPDEPARAGGRRRLATSAPRIASAMATGRPIGRRAPNCGRFVDRRRGKTTVTADRERRPRGPSLLPASGTFCRRRRAQGGGKASDDDVLVGLGDRDRAVTCEGCRGGRRSVSGAPEW